MTGNQTPNTEPMVPRLKGIEIHPEQQSQKIGVTLDEE
jgi:hypothetical protein